MLEQEIIVTNPLGIHARPASLIVQTSGAFESEITLMKEGSAANAKSIMSVMMLAASFGTKIVVRTKGKDEQRAMDAVVKLFEAKFNEQ